MLPKLSVFFTFLLFLAGCDSEGGNGQKPAQEEEQQELETFKVLFIGNSHTYFNQGVDFHLTKYVERSNLKIKPLITNSTFGGHSLEDHLSTQATIDKLESENWDVVVLQENSSVARDYQETVVANMEQFNDQILLGGSSTYLFMTWAYLDQPDMYFNIRNTYEAAAQSTRAEIVPVGTVFRTYLNDSGSDILYHADGVHPSLEGTFLATTMFYIEVFEQDPRANSYTAGLPSETAEMLKQLAWITLRGS